MNNLRHAPRHFRIQPTHAIRPNDKIRRMKFVRLHKLQYAAILCTPPQAAGAACKRDVVCASKKCDIPAGQEVGVCKQSASRRQYRPGFTPVRD
jgi:hypothetical protein